MTLPIKDKQVIQAKRDELEGRFTRWRLSELKLNPVIGNFDVQHLLEINRRIFQDLPNNGFSEVTPGIYRPTSLKDRDWIKTRTLETNRYHLTVAYSSMDKWAKEKLENILEQVDPKKLSELELHEFTSTLGNLYSELDYIHPFKDGNSRTLREFTRQLAQASGYIIQWERFAISPAGRDLLYIARDLSVNELAIPRIKDQETLRDVLLTMDQFGANKSLPAFLSDVVQREREIPLHEIQSRAIIQAKAKYDVEKFREIALKRKLSISGYGDNGEEWKSFSQEKRDTIEQFNAIPKDQQGQALIKMERELMVDHLHDKKLFEKNIENARGKEGSQR